MPPKLSAQQDEILVPEDRDIDADSAYGASIANTDTTSLASSVYNYKYENGRRYQSFREGQYFLPNDEQEQQREDIFHHIWRLLLGGDLWHAPFTKPDSTDPKRILDLGTGTGIWAMEVADELPHTEVEGVDLSPIQPPFVPPNCKFVVDDYEAEWRFENGKTFDLIHMRNLAACVADWPQLFRRAFEHTTPGDGWVEYKDINYQVGSDDGGVEKVPGLVKWHDDVNRATELVGKRLRVVDEVEGWMKDAGFVDVKREVFKVPHGPWAKEKRYKELGYFYQVMSQEGIEAFTLSLFTNVLGMTLEQAHASAAIAKKEFARMDIHLFLSFSVIQGRRPKPE